MGSEQLDTEDRDGEVPEMTDCEPFDARKELVDKGLRDLFEHLTTKDNHPREYALLVIFNIRTAIELHRAWHVSLYTHSILQQVKDTFGLTMNWHLGVLRMTFLVDTGRYHLQRRVPYDYDSQNQDLFMKVASALCAGDITIDQALKLQNKIRTDEVIKETYTKGLTKFLRLFPGRLIAYPALSTTCAVIFFKGDWEDAGVAAITGLATGISTYLIEEAGKDHKRNYGILVDFVAGLLSGIIGGLFYRYNGQTTCLSAVFLGSLYWFFYGTAFVVGLLEIVAGQVETGVTRFVAVTVKTFVLSISAGIGLIMILEQPLVAWEHQKDCNCGLIDLDTKWWRIPLYLASSAAALAQYRVRIIEYWRGLSVQLVGYEVQYQMLKFMVERSGSSQDNSDTIISNVAGAAMAVMTAFFVAEIATDPVNKMIYKKLSPKDKENVENIIIYNQPLNKYSILMPALYQLVPGSLIANLWFSFIFPPTDAPRDAARITCKDTSGDAAGDVFGDLMIVSLSLAIGLIWGYVCASVIRFTFYRVLLSKRYGIANKSDDGFKNSRRGGKIFLLEMIAPSTVEYDKNEFTGDDMKDDFGVANEARDTNEDDWNNE